MRAMLLAAGMGTRLLPFTNIIPKPLFPVLNTPLLNYHLHWMKHYHVQEVVVNLHHLAGNIEEMIGDGSRFGLRVSYSREPELLGTGGGIKRVQDIFDETFVVANADILAHVDLKEALRFHRDRKAVATMVLKADPELLHLGAIGIDGEGSICSFPHLTPIEKQPRIRAAFTGVHIFEPSIFDYFPPEEVFCINMAVYPELIRKNAGAYGYCMEGYWSEIGTPARYFQANVDLISGKDEHLRQKALAEAYQEISPRVWIAKTAVISKGVTFHPPVVLGYGCKLFQDARVGPEVIVGHNCRIGKGSKIERSLLWPDVEIPAGAVVERKLIGGEYQVDI